MNSLFLTLLLLFSLQNPKIPKNDPNGIWQSDTGTKFDLKLNDSDLKVKLVDGSNPTYLKYEVDLKNTGEPNTYAGAGYFVAKLQGNECRYDTSWTIVVVQPTTIAGYISHVVPDAATCGVKERGDEFTQLKKVN